MTRVILITFGFLGWAWFEMSGGSSFEPGENGVTALAAFDPVVVEEADLPSVTPEPPVVTRADTTEAPLTRVSQPRIVVKPAPSFVETVKADVVTEAGATQTTLVVGGLGGDLANLGQAISVGANDPVSDAIAAAVDYRVVSGSRVNLRSGPSTEFSVVTRLVRGNEVEILQDDGLGWVKLRALNGNEIGWMSDSFLVAAD